MKLYLLSLILFFGMGFAVVNHSPTLNLQTASQPFFHAKSIKKLADGQYVHKYTLSNGLTVLVREVKTVPKVSLQLWYNVGSKDELLGEKGIAHLIEHMIFKGTDILTESDINVIVHKLSGSCNAFTSYDYTGYLFDFPSQHYHESFKVMADCMQNVRFDGQMLNSEVKAVIQELKMYKDQYSRSLMEMMISTIFADHPYHYPIVGFKRDLWTVSPENLRAFYKKHYKPNNATLVVVGDVDPEQVYKEAECCFGAIAPDAEYKKQEFIHELDIAATSLVIYRDVQQPVYMYAFTVPGIKFKQEHISQLAEWILGKGKGSRLYKKLINELQYATSLDIGLWDLFDYGVFFISCDPADGITQEQIEKVIIQELADIVDNGFTDQEFERAYKKSQSSFYSMLENPEDQAYTIGKNFLATGDENYLFTCMDAAYEALKNDIQMLIAHHMRPAVMHKGSVMPIPESEKGAWDQLQVFSDEEDQAILSARVRTSPVEQAQYAHSITVQNPVDFAYPQAHEMQLANGLKVLYHQNDAVPKIALVLRFKAQHYYDPNDKVGLFNFLTAMMTEGTKHYTADTLSDFVESKGMSLQVYPGCMVLTMLKEDLKTGLAILQELLTEAIFEPHEIEKIRVQLISDIKNYWDEPKAFAGHLVKQRIYKNHPYSKNLLGSIDSVKNITRDDLVKAYKQWICPQGATLAVVGDIQGYDLASLLKNSIEKWHGDTEPSITFPAVQVADFEASNYPMTRDQIVLCFARPSVDRKDPLYDALLVFDQIFGSGMLHSMTSRLFQLREQSGLFYTIDGSFLSGSDEQPGMLFVKTIVSKDRLQEAEQAITNTIVTAVNEISDEELEEAKRAIINASMDNFASNINCARAFLHLDRFGLPKNYFNTRVAKLQAITKQDVQKAVAHVLQDKKLFVLRVGRV